MPLRRAVAVGVTAVLLGGAAFACRQLVGINVPAGSVHVTARWLGATVSQADVLVQAQSITNIAVVPSP